MEEIRRFVDEMITWAGITGDYVPMLRHILLTITAILLAMLSDFLCRKIVVPLISKITEKTEASWDDVLLNKKVLTSACHIVPAVVIWSLMPLIYLEYPPIGCYGNQNKRFASLFFPHSSACQSSSGTNHSPG
jgi:miniconductance mechanosensitive channel